MDRRVPVVGQQMKRISYCITPCYSTCWGSLALRVLVIENGPLNLLVSCRLQVVRLPIATMQS